MSETCNHDCAGCGADCPSRTAPESLLAPLNERSRVKYDGKVYQIIPETFNGHYRENTLQFLMQLVVNDKNGKPTPTPSSSDI